MRKSKMYKLSIILCIIGVLFLILSYFMFHYLLDTGLTSIKQEEANKPFVTNLAGNFGVLCLFGGLVSFLFGLTCLDK